MQTCHYLVILLRAFGACALPENLFEHAADPVDGHILAVIGGFTCD
jgi:hypothetical protein